MHPDVLDRLSGGQIRIAADVDLDFGDMACAFGQALAAAKGAHGNQLNFSPDDHSGKKLGLGTGGSKTKKIITAYLMRNMTSEEVRARGAYTDAASGEPRDEIGEWLDEIRRHL